MKNILYVLIGVMAGFVLSGLLVFVSRAPAGQPIILQPAPTKAPIAVHVVGAVPRPGLYEFPEGARVQNAIDAAGGMLAQANADALNLAAPLMDGQKLEVPYKDGGGAASTQEGDVELPSSLQPDASQPESASPGSSEQPSAGVADLVNINTATLEELDSLPGIGPTLAQRIIDYRTQNGPFSTIEELMDVSGIGPATFEKLKDLITV